MSDIKQILITGGAGFIGCHTVDLLLARGYSVRVLDNLSTGRREHLPISQSGFEFIQGDVEDADEVQRCMQGMSACIHLAGQVSVQQSIETPVGSARTNILGFINVLEASRRTGVQRVVYASSAAVYGHASQLPIVEDAPRAPISPYGLEKCINEDYAALYSKLYGLICVGLRYFNVYGPLQDPASQYSGVITRFTDCLRSKRQPLLYGDGSQSRDFIFVGDVARANQLALESMHSGRFNVGTGVSVTLIQLLTTLSALSNTELIPVSMPAQAGDILLSSADVSAIAVALGFKAQTTLHEGLSVTLRSELA